MRDSTNIEGVEKLGIDLMGFIFYDKSPRFVSQTPSYLPERCHRVGVFVNSTMSSILSKVLEYRLDYIQLHGDENADYCKVLKAKLPSRVKIIKSISVSHKDDVLQSKEYEQSADLFLFENKCASYGGSGMKFKWSHLSSYNGRIPFILSGGIGPDDINSILEISHSNFWGIDLNSRFESSPGIKDTDLLRTFIKRIDNEQNQPIIY